MTKRSAPFSPEVRAARGTPSVEVVEFRACPEGVGRRCGFNTSGPDGLIDRKAPGQPSRLNATHRAALAAADRDRADTGGARRRPLANRRSLPMAVG